MDPYDPLFSFSKHLCAKINLNFMSYIIKICFNNLTGFKEWEIVVVKC